MLFKGFIAFHVADLFDSDGAQWPALPGIVWPLVRSCSLVGLGALLAYPAGVLAAIYPAQCRDHWLARGIRLAAELLDGVPDLLFGMAVFALALPFLNPDSALAACLPGFALALLMFPIVVRTVEEGMAAHQIQPGFGWWQTLRMLGKSWRDLIAAGFQACARGLSATSPLIILIAFAPTQTLPILLYTESASAFPQQVDHSWGAAFVLLTLIIGLHAVMRVAAPRAQLASYR
jgi:ABC-type phosphate transport system permease subunit